MSHPQTSADETMRAATEEISNFGGHAHTHARARKEKNPLTAQGELSASKFRTRWGFQNADSLKKQIAGRRMRSKFGGVGSVRSGFSTEPGSGRSHSKRRARRVPFPVVTKLIPAEMCTRRRIPFGPSLSSAFLSVPPHRRRRRLTPSTSVARSAL